MPAERVYGLTSGRRAFLDPVYLAIVEQASRFERLRAAKLGGRRAMLQMHTNARTSRAGRAEIARSEEPTGILARHYGVSTGTVRKWRKRGPDDPFDHSARPRALPWKASAEVRAVVCALCRATDFAPRRPHRRRRPRPRQTAPSSGSSAR